MVLWASKGGTRQNWQQSPTQKGEIRMSHQAANLPQSEGQRQPAPVIYLVDDDPSNRLPRLFDSFFTTKPYGLGWGCQLFDRSWKLTEDESGQKTILAAELVFDSPCL
jgi:hypothetical protein